MDKIERMKLFLKAKLPIVDEPDLDVVIAAAVALAKYYGQLAMKEDVTDEQFQSACSLVVAAFDGDTIHHLEECIQGFKEEVFNDL